MRPARIVLGFLVAVIATAVGGTAASTQFVLARLQALGADIPLGVRITTTLQDVLGMGPTYAALVAVGFAIAFSIAALILRTLPHRGRTPAYVAAGVLAVVAMLTVLRLVFETTPVAGATTAGGMVAQAVAGGLGGYLFARLAAGRAPARSS